MAKDTSRKIFNDPYRIYYFIHAWISPSGDLLLPKTKPNGTLESHDEIVQRYMGGTPAVKRRTDSMKALQMGFIRILYEKIPSKTLAFNFYNKLSKYAEAPGIRPLLRALDQLELEILKRNIPLPDELIVGYNIRQKTRYLYTKSFDELKLALSSKLRGLTETKPFLLDWGIVVKDELVKPKREEDIHFQVFQRMNVQKTDLRISWIFDFDKTLYIRLILPDGMKVEDIQNKFNNLNKYYQGIKKLLDTIPYEKLVVELSTDAGLFIYNHTTISFLKYLNEIFGL